VKTFIPLHVIGDDKVRTSGSAHPGIGPGPSEANVVVSPSYAFAGAVHAPPGSEYPVGDIHPTASADDCANTISSKAINAFSALCTPFVISFSVRKQKQIPCNLNHQSQYDYPAYF
jgi:hypothetical protein